MPPESILGSSKLAAFAPAYLLELFFAAADRGAGVLSAKA